MREAGDDDRSRSAGGASHQSDAARARREARDMAVATELDDAREDERQVRAPHGEPVEREVDKHLE